MKCKNRHREQINTNKRGKCNKNVLQGKLTLTALEVSLVKGGTIPTITTLMDRPNRRQAERMIDVFAPRQKV